MIYKRGVFTQLGHYSQAGYEWPKKNARSALDRLGIIKIIGVMKSYRIPNALRIFWKTSVFS